VRAKSAWPSSSSAVSGSSRIQIGRGIEHQAREADAPPLPAESRAREARARARGPAASSAPRSHRIGGSAAKGERAAQVLLGVRSSLIAGRWPA
jgi:hypothetical protein